MLGYMRKINSNMSDIDDKEFILEFIDCYRRLPALWNLNSHYYDNRQIKDKQGDALWEKYKEKYPLADKREAFRKINFLIAKYKHEVWRMKHYPEKVTELYFFNAMKFIPINTSELFGNNMFESKSERMKRKGTGFDEKVTNLEQSEILFANSKKKFKNMCTAWAGKLQGLREDQFLLAERLIEDIIFRGQINLLNKETTLTNNETSTVTENYDSEGYGSPFDWEPGYLPPDKKKKCDKLMPKSNTEMNVCELQGPKDEALPMTINYKFDESTQQIVLD